MAIKNHLIIFKSHGKVKLPQITSSARSHKKHPVLR